MIWSGWGWLGYVIIAAVLIGTIKLPESMAGPGFLQANPWILAVSWVVSSALCWTLGRWLNRGLPIRVLGYRSIHDSHTDGHTIFVFRLEFGGLAALPIHILLAVYGPQFFDR
ncbi:MAG: hypothetical protein U0797_20835 [Gemmataceae bacterium]